MTRFDDAVARLQRKPDDPDVGWITAQDVANAFRDLFEEMQDLAISKQDQLPLYGSDSQVLTFSNLQWVPMDLPKMDGAGFKIAGVLSGAQAVLPAAPDKNEAYIVGLPVPIAVTTALPAASAGDMIVWDGSSWHNAGQAVQMSLPDPVFTIGDGTNGKQGVLYSTSKTPTPPFLGASPADWRELGQVRGNGPDLPVVTVSDAGRVLVVDAAGNPVWDTSLADSLTNIAALKKITEGLTNGAVSEWAAGAYVADSVVLHDGKLWHNTAVTQAEPGKGTEWDSLALEDILAKATGGGAAQGPVSTAPLHLHPGENAPTAGLPNTDNWKATPDEWVTASNAAFPEAGTYVYDDFTVMVDAPGATRSFQMWNQKAAYTSLTVTSSSWWRAVYNPGQIQIDRGARATTDWKLGTGDTTVLISGSVGIHMRRKAKPPVKGQVFTTDGTGTGEWADLPIPTATAADKGKVLAVDAAGALTWQTPAAPVVVKDTQPTAADYGGTTIPADAVWIKKTP